MNILHVNAGYWPWVGGAQTYAQAMAERFARDDDSSSVMTTTAKSIDTVWLPHVPQLAAGRETHNGVNITRLKMAHLPLAPFSFYALRRFAPMLAGLGGMGHAALEQLAPLMPRVPGMAAALAAHTPRPDVIHAMNISLEWPMVAAARFAKQHNIPFIVTPFVHVGDWHVQRNYLMPHQMAVLRQASRVIVQTSLEQEALVAHGVHLTKIEILGMGVDPAEHVGGSAQRFRAAYSIRPSTKIVTFMGTLTFDKGAVHALEATRVLAERGEDVVLALAGEPVVPGGFEEAWRRLPEGVRGHVLRLGNVGAQAKNDLLEATDALVMPSRVDSFGIVYLEAWLHGKPVIGARAGGVPAVIREGEDGLLVDFGDVAGLADGISRLLSDPALSQRMGQAGRAKVLARFTWDEIYLRLRAITDSYTPSISSV